MRQLEITSRREGFRRAGRAWSAAPTTVDADAFSAEQLEQLRAEPMLIVVEARDGSRDDRIRAALADLPADDEALWTKSGKPDLSALRDRSGIDDVTAAERDRLWGERAE